MPSPAAVPVAPAVVANGSGPASIDKQPRLGTPRERAEQEYRRGIAALNLGRLGDAQGALRSALKEDAGYQEARQLLLKLLVEQRSLEEARQLLAEGLAVVPSQVSWIMTLARLQIEAGDAKAAWATLEAGLPYARNSSEYQGFAGGVLHRLQREPEAADAYRAALRLAPNDGRWWLGLGLALEAGGAAGEARQAFQNARASGSLSPEMTVFVDQRLR
jgi:MSHA biogenesis protein MshN